MRAIALLFIFGIYFQSNAQIFQNVDELNEFEGFSFGMSTTELTGSLNLDLVISYGLKYYKYQDASLKELYGFKIEEINLGFRNDKLEYFDFYFHKLSKQEFDVIRHKLEVRFGSSSTVDAIETGVVNAVQWPGQKVTVDLYRYEKESIDINDRNKTVLAVTSHTSH